MKTWCPITTLNQLFSEVMTNDNRIHQSKTLWTSESWFTITVVKAAFQVLMDTLRNQY